MLILVGGVNWGLIGLLNYNLIESIFGAWPTLVQIIYVLVGVAVIYEVTSHKENCKLCGKK